MKPPSFLSSAAIALVTPWLIIVGLGIWRPSQRVEPWTVVFANGLINWMFMAGPQIVVTALGAFCPSCRRFTWLPLLMLTLLLCCFEAWILWCVPVRESGLAWIFYFPLALAVALLSMLGLFMARARQKTGL